MTRSFLGPAVFLLTLLLLAPSRLLACRCPDFDGLLETAKRAPTVIEARVLSHHAAPDGTWAESIVVEVVRSFKGKLLGQVRLYGSGRGDCTVRATSFAVGETFVFVPSDEFPQAPEGKPGYGLYGVCGAVSGRVHDGQVEGFLNSSKRGQDPEIGTIALPAFLRAIDAPEQPKGEHR